MSQTDKPTHEPLTDPREIRKLLQEVARGRLTIQGEDAFRDLSPIGGIVHQCMGLANHFGYSGEDAMTFLAYNALLRYDEIYIRMLHQLNTTAPSAFIQEPPNAD